MAAPARNRIAWATHGGELVLTEPGLAEIRVHSAELAVAYNDPHNARLMGHGEPFSPEEVVDHYRSLLSEGARPFLLYLDGTLAGDADLRGIRDGAAEFAFMIAARDRQGKGLGTRLAIMVHACAFTMLGLERVYASIDPLNPASRRVLEKLGYAVSKSTEARSFADEPGDLTMLLERPTFLTSHATAISQLRFGAA